MSEPRKYTQDRSQPCNPHGMPSTSQKARSPTQTAHSPNAQDQDLNNAGTKVDLDATVVKKDVRVPTGAHSGLVARSPGSPQASKNAVAADEFHVSTDTHANQLRDMSPFSRWVASSGKEESWYYLGRHEQSQLKYNSISKRSAKKTSTQAGQVGTSVASHSD